MEMSLNEEIFELVKSGSKHIEIRLNDEKRRKLNIKDTIIFSKRPEKKEKIYATVRNLKYYDTFSKLVKNYDIRDLYFNNSNKEDLLNLLSTFYTKEEEEKYGVVAIDFEIKEKSCGIVVFKDDKVLLVHHEVGHWGIPKGHMEEDETEEETAIREVKEETNITAKIIPGFRKVITYSPKENTMKDVVFFIGEALNDDLKPQVGEITEVKYVSINEALEIISNNEAKMVLEEAIKYYI